MVKHDFDALGEWDRLSDSELMQQYWSENKDRLQRIVLELDDKGQIGKIESSNFQVVVRAMRKRYEEGSRGLGEVIAEAADHRENGRNNDANEALETFAKNCTSPFYRQIALNYRK